MHTILNGFIRNKFVDACAGLFRKHMMGKRVNFACRSVITPDPYLAIDEIGIPEVFAKKLTFSEYVNTHNVDKLRALLKRGPQQHPGYLLVAKPNAANSGR